jgi:SAM-dependent methyltransferase
MPEATGPEPSRGIDYERLYQYRHRGVDRDARIAVWNEIAPFVHAKMGRPDRVLDPAAGWGEFINAVPAPERWMVDAVEFPEHLRDPQVKAIFGDIREVELPDAYFGGIFVSNLLEHLPSPDAIADFLTRMRRAAAPGGRVVVMGPNFRYCAKEYFDFADHILPLTHVTVKEHMVSAGLEVEETVARFLPYSFGGVLPASAALTRTYLRTPLAWRVLGKQFLVIGRAPASGA